MNKYKNTNQDIHKRMYIFVLNCFRDVVMKIPHRLDSAPIIGQIASSLTSMGANDREADASNSKNDFIARYAIVKKETNETIFWLSLIKDLALVPEKIVNPYIAECEEIFRIVSSILLSTKGHSKYS
jgi:four helix bundle protein